MGSVLFDLLTSRKISTENLTNKGLLGQNLWALLDARVMQLFVISAKLLFFGYHLKTISKNFFSTPIRGGANFFGG
jgi:hypothetical protein